MKKKVIDVKTLEVWESYSEAARCLGVTVPAIYHSIYFGWKVKGRHLEDFEYWRGLHPLDKEKMAQRNFYFM